MLFPHDMKTPLSLFVSAAFTLASVPALAQDRADDLLSGRPPPTGTGMLVTGSILSGVAAVNLLSSPLCKTSLIPRDTQDVCLGSSLVIGGVLAAVGLPLLFVGISRHNTYVEWKRQHRAISLLTDVGVAPTPGGAALTWSASF
ncbi:hypothetical protein D7X30_33465 [Corallococcus sp. AB011P]|uniref:hypothetical protein n=1 Tax=Corallococcus sp. AB011P TaxID=2316735 RepID=UPI000EA33CC9|nr:hypothetical protein [Corallococcus sp. AB011P]RKG52517.1 hypothetical protein D7X30_33465 [Corallococcus sp. AB011P]